MAQSFIYGSQWRRASDCSGSDGGLLYTRTGGRSIRSGRVGSLGLGPRSPEFARARVKTLRQETNRPFNLNFFAHSAPEGASEVLEQARAVVAPRYRALGLGDPPQISPSAPHGFGDTQLDLLLDARPSVATFHFGVPNADAIEMLRKAGITLGATATTVAEAHAVENSGCHFVVAQGCEAGGIADGRAIAASLALGAAGVRLGTAFLRCPEADTDAPRFARLAKAKDTETMVTSAFSGRANRVALSAFAQHMNEIAAVFLPYPLQYGLVGPLQEAGGEDHAAHQFGQTGALARAMPAKDLVRMLVDETAACLTKLSIERN